MGNRSNISLVGNATEGQNVGVGEGVYKDKILGSILQFKELSVTGTTMKITSDDENIYFSAATGGGGGTITGGANGLCTSGENIVLGGSLTGDTTINLNTHNLTFDNTSSNFSVTGNTVHSYASLSNYICGKAILSMAADVQAAMGVLCDGNTNCQTSLVINQFENYFLDEIHTSGMSYSADYSTIGALNPRWIPDAGWVTGQTGGASYWAQDTGFVYPSTSGDDIRLDKTTCLYWSGTTACVSAIESGGNTWMCMKNNTSCVGIGPTGAIVLQTASAGIYMCSGSNDFRILNPAACGGGEEALYINSSGSVVSGASAGGGGLSSSNNGLCDNGTTVGLGGTLANNTVISGNSFSYGFCFHQLDHFCVNAASGVRLNGCGGSYLDLTADVTLCAGGNSTFICQLPAGTESNVIHISSAGKLYCGAAGSGGVAVSGVTDDSITTYINASGDICAEPNLKFNGTTLAIAGNVAFCSGADRYITISNTVSAPSRHLLICAQQYHGFETSGDVSGGRVCLCGGFGNNTSESGGSGTGGDAHIFGGTGKIHTGSATGGDIVICGGRGWVTTSGTGTGGTVHLWGGEGDTTGRVQMSNLPSKVSETCVVWIDASGNLSTATPASDSRLKCCVEPISSATSMLSGICGYSAEFNNLSNCEGCCEYVFLAQEVEKELPLAVKNGVIIDDIDYKKIEYDQLIPVMWNIIKEQEARIAALESQ